MGLYGALKVLWIQNNREERGAEAYFTLHHLLIWLALCLIRPHILCEEWTSLHVSVYVYACVCVCA